MRRRKWTQSDINDVMARRSRGETLESIGNRYGVTKERIRNVEAKETRLRYAQIQRDTAANVLDLEIEYLNVPARVFNCLRNANLKTVRDILPLKDYHLLRLPNFGRSSADELINCLKSLGVTWPVKGKS